MLSAFPLHHLRLKKWIADRLEWIDSQDFLKPAMVVNREGNEVAGTGAGRPSTIRMACLVGKIHYTTDGSDPRLPGGAISPTAAQYQDPIPVAPSLRLFARVPSDYGLWIAPLIYSEPPKHVANEAK